MEEEVTATQAALMSGLSERTIRRKIAAGQIPARRLAANRFAIRVSDVPTRDSMSLVERVTDLERRVGELERQITALSAHAPMASASPADVTPTSVATVRDLLLQLVQETERMGAIVATPGSETDDRDPQTQPKRSHAQG
jgi:predicted site-specific integrase-resolvase